VYDHESCRRTFREDLEAHLLHGLVISTSTFFMMGRYISTDMTEQMVCDPWCNDLGGRTANLFHLYLMAGDIKEIFTYPLREVPWVSFERGNVLRIHSYSKLKKRCAKISTETT
jgi:hypothetical protein